MEDTHAYEAGLAGHLREQNVTQVEINRPDRDARRQQDKSHPLGAATVLITVSKRPQHCSHQGERVTSIPVPPHWRHFMSGQCANGLTSRIPSSLSVALVSRHGAGPTNLTGVTLRPIQDPSDIGQCDDILLFYGARMAQEVKRFATAIKGELPPVMILAPSLDWSDVCLALRHGARCYLLENQYTAPLEELLVCACQGVCFLDPAIGTHLYELAAAAEAHEVWSRHGDAAAAVVLDRLPALSLRERQVMDLLASGHGVRDVARDLFLTDKTVRNYLSRIYRKLGARNRTEAVLRWLGRLDSTARRQQ
ncbi:response regulator transcription factor [Streptomyces sp. NBC_00199]|uniref:helix-turn-helix transcriptional regulator n=1 Tax=Streptomyces sp. NBC_00199 TaxID=2975678 RepID=UPI00224EDB4A|nr:response regulator transcription factor [Streptomyces sp. NBC_00199]MCX5267651.1 response regulator transcription factor [Streptomyces sp. NBC_00199]